MGSIGGGGIKTSGTTGSKIKNTIIKNNTAGMGAGIYIIVQLQFLKMFLFYQMLQQVIMAVAFISRMDLQCSRILKFQITLVLIMVEVEPLLVLTRYLQTS